MKVLVTGALGRVGAATVTALLDAGHEVTACDQRLPPPEPPAARAYYLQADLTDAGHAYAAVLGHDAVVHAAAIPAPRLNPPHVLFQTNVTSVFNTVEAAVRLGVRRFVNISSEAAIGRSWAERPFLFDYVPVDEDHPVRPQDAYSTGKLISEVLMDAAVRRSDLTAVSIRPAWVQWEGSYERSLGPTVRGDADANAGYWTYIDVYDLADALRLACEAELTGHEVVFIASPDNYAGRPLAEAVRALHGDAVEVRPHERPDAGALSIAKARRLLGYAPTRSWRDYLDADGRLRPEVRDRLERGETGVQRGRRAAGH